MCEWREENRDRWHTDVPTAGILWVLLANEKTWYKKCSVGAVGLSMHGPDQGCFLPGLRSGIRDLQISS